MRCTLWRVMPIARAMPATGRGSPRTAPSTCHQAAVRPAGRASSSATARTWPLSRKRERRPAEHPPAPRLIAHAAAVSSK